MFEGFDVLATLRNSPIFMVLIGGSIVTLTAAVERAIYFRKRNGNTVAILAKALRQIRSGEHKDAYNTLEASPHPLGAAGMRVLESPKPGEQSLEESLHVCLSQQKMLFERNVSILGTMAAVAPLVGLLGTIWGIMRAFRDMAMTGSSAPAVVAAGVAEALLTTAAGIVIAVPAILAYNHFTRRINVMLTEAENGARSLKAAVLEAGQLGGQLQADSAGSIDEARPEQGASMGAPSSTSQLVAGR
jgi:biopolymer transport protein ExbB